MEHQHSSKLEEQALKPKPHKTKNRAKTGRRARRSCIFLIRRAGIRYLGVKIKSLTSRDGDGVIVRYHTS